MKEYIVYADVINEKPNLSVIKEESNFRNKQNDSWEFRKKYCLCGLYIPWFTRKELLVSDSISSFKYKGLKLSTKLKNSFKNLVD